MICYLNMIMKIIIFKLLILLFNTCSRYKLSIDMYIEKFIENYDNMDSKLQNRYRNEYNNYLKYFI